MPHQWLEGNLPVSAKCAVCDKTCGSVLRLQDWRCLWCKAMVSMSRLWVLLEENIKHYQHIDALFAQAQLQYLLKVDCFPIFLKVNVFYYLGSWKVPFAHDNTIDNTELFVKANIPPNGKKTLLLSYIYIFTVDISDRGNKGIKIICVFYND